MSTKKKPLLVKLAESLTGYVDDTLKLREQVTLLVHEAKITSQELETCKKITQDSRTEIEKLQKEKVQCHLLLENKEKVLAETQEKLKLYSDKCAVIQKDLELKRGNENKFIDTMILLLQRSNLIKNTDSFDKKKSIAFFVFQIENLLEEMGIIPFEDIGIPVNPAFHKIVDSEKTEDTLLIGQISKSVRRGFKMGDKCVIEQEVVIYVS